MAINTIALATTMTEELDRAVAQKAVTGFFADNALRAKFVGAGTVLIPEVGVSGLGDYDRDTGFVQGAITVSNKSHTLTMDRGRSFHLDAQDADESGIPDLAGEVSGEFVRTQVVPELDAYVLSKLAGYALGKSQTVTGTPSSQAYKMLTEAIGKVQNAVGYEEELVCFVNSSFHSAIQSTDELTRQLTVGNFRKGAVDLQVKSLNGVAIFPVNDSRMKTAYTFNDGASEDQEAGGFTPTTTAKSIGFLVLPKRAGMLVKKTEKTRIFAPNANQKADAWKIDYRIYYDLFIKNSLAAGVYAYTY